MAVRLEDWELALAREAVIRPLADQTEVTAGLVARASAELGISRSLVYRLDAKFRKRPQVSSLLSGKRRRRTTTRVLPIESVRIPCVCDYEPCLTRPVP